MKPLDRRILAIALPAIVSNITTPVLGLVDVAITGHFGAAAYIGAIALGGTMFNMLYWLFGFLRMGTAGLTAQAFGASDRHAQSAALWRALALAGAFSLVLIALSRPVGGLVLQFLDADDAVEPLARAYFNIGIFGAPAVLGTYVLTGWYLGMQNTRIPMWVALLTDVANIAVSLVLVYVFEMRIEGVAFGTISAQWLGFVVSLIVLWRKFHPHHISRAELLEMPALKKLFSINADIFLRTLCLVAVTVWFTHAGASISVEVLAANALLMQLFMLFSFFSDGFAFAAEALVGHACGAGDMAGVRHTVRRLMGWGISVAAIFTIFFFAGGRWAMGVLSDSPSVVATAHTYLPWIVAVPLCGIGAFVLDGVFIGLTRTRSMMWSVAVSMVVFFGVYFAAEPSLLNHGLWLAFISYLLVRGIYLLVSYENIAGLHRSDA